MRHFAFKQSISLILINFFVTFFSLFFLSAASNHAAIKDYESPILLRINDKFFNKQEIEERCQYAIKLSKLKLIKLSQKNLVREKIIQKIIDEELINQKGEKLKIEIDKEELEKAIEQYAKQQKKSLKSLKTYLAKNKLSLNILYKQLETELIWSKIIEEIIRPKIRVSEMEVKELLEQRKIVSKIEHYRLAEILFDNSPSSSQFAENIFNELENGADFQSLVQQFSLSSSNKKNGEIGWLTQADLNPKIFAAIRSKKAGQYSSPVALADGYHIFKILETKSDSALNDSEMDLARNYVANQKIEAISKSYLHNLKKRAFIEIFDKNIQ